jgi:hypothetical protein
MTKDAVTGVAIDSATLGKIADEAFAALDADAVPVPPFSTRVIQL